MSSRFVIAAVLVLAFFGVGWVVSRSLFAEADDPPMTAPPPGRAAARPAPDAAPVWSARVVAAAGTVERRPPGGDWVAAVTGDRLAASDAFRTGLGSTAVLEIGSGTEVEVAQETEFTVAQVTDTVAGLRLEGGRIAARVERGAGSELRIGVADGDAVAQTDDGEFTALASGQGDLSVAAIRGRVRLSARGKTVQIAAGEQSVAAAGSAPTAPRAIPPSLFLKVNRPGDTLRRREVRLAGATAPGASVTVDGVAVRVEPDGQFAADIALREGRNRVLFRAFDPLGREQKQQVPLEVDSKGPGIHSEVRWR